LCFVLWSLDKVSPLSLSLCSFHLLFECVCFMVICNRFYLFLFISATTIFSNSNTITIPDNGVGTNNFATSNVTVSGKCWRILLKTHTHNKQQIQREKSEISALSTFSCNRFPSTLNCLQLFFVFFSN
jgi:hypothetical protein